MNGILSNNTYDFPLYSTIPANNEEFEEFMDSVKDFFVNTLGFYLYKKEIYSFDPNFNVYAYYFSYSENGYPIFCFYNERTANKDYNYKRFILSPCNYVEGQGYQALQMPYHNYGTSAYGTALTCYADRSTCISFVFNPWGQDYLVNYKVVVQDIKLEDGRRVIFFKIYNRQTGLPYGQGQWKAMFFSNVVFRDQQTKDWIFLTNHFSTSYNPQFQQCLGKNDIRSKSCFAFQNVTDICKTGGLIPSTAYGKDYLIKQKLYIGNETYIPNIYRYSNLIGIQNNTGLMGNIVNIENKNFLILYNSSLLLDSYYAPINSSDSNVYSKTDLYNQISHTWQDENAIGAAKMSIIRTESLIILI